MYIYFPYLVHQSVVAKSPSRWISHGICKTEMGQKPGLGLSRSRDTLTLKSVCVEVLGNSFLRIGAMARVLPTYPPEKKTPLFFYRPVPVTAIVRGGVVAVVPLHRPVLITVVVGDGVMVVVPLRRPVSVTAVDGGVFRACRSLFHLASVITWP